jgi:ZIP family zinc transporter/zinc and cadmium transporter
MKTQILLLAFIASLAVILGGTLIISRKSWPTRVQETLLALSAGFILSLVFLKLVPVSFEFIGETAAIWILIGFATVHFFEHTIVGHLHFGEETHHDVMISKTTGYSAFAGLFTHAFFDGLSISVGFQYDFFIGLLIFLAILLHKFPEGLTIGSIMMTAGFPRKMVLYSAIGIGLATFLGACSVFLLENVDMKLAGMAFAFSAGTVTYVGASDLIPEVNKTKSRLPPILVFAGMVLFYLSEKILDAILR